MTTCHLNSRPSSSSALLGTMDATAGVESLTPMSHIVIRISNSVTTHKEADDHIDQQPTHEAYVDEVLVRTVPSGDEDAPQLVPIFSSNEYEALTMQIKSGTCALSSPKKVFSFPLADGGASNELVSIFESTLTTDESTDIFSQTLNNQQSHSNSYYIMTIHELCSTTSICKSKNSFRQLTTSSTSQHIMQLYRQHRLDTQIRGRRLLHGTKGSNLNAYTLRSKPAVVFFDCDDCLYFDNWSIARHLTKKIEDHCKSEFGLPAGYAYQLYKEHGTALRGLIAEGYLSRDCDVSMNGFLDKVHDLPIHELLHPDVELREMISRMDPSIRRYVFTASVHHHAKRCLEALGVADLFDGIIDVKDCNFETKHSKSSFLAAMTKAGVEDPEACVLLDDSVTNIRAAREVGWRAVLVGRVGRDCGTLVTSEHAEHEIDIIHDLPNAFPELFLK